MKSDKKSTKQENTVSLNLGRKTIYLYNLNDRDNQIELAFQPKYGQIISYRWYGDGYMMLGFSEGYFVVISTRILFLILIGYIYTIVISFNNNIW